MAKNGQQNRKSFFEQHLQQFSFFWGKYCQLTDLRHLSHLFVLACFLVSSHV